MQPARSAIRLSTAFVFCLLLLIGCKKDDPPPPPPGEVYYPIETGPSLSVDRAYVYLALSDSMVPSLSGIYRARTTRPEREIVWLDSNLSFPSISANFQHCAALRNDSLIWRTLADSSVTIPTLGMTFDAACFVGNAQVIAAKDSALYRVTIPSGNLSFDRYGYDPVALTDSSFLFVAHIEQFEWAVIEVTLSGTTDTLYKRTSVDRPYWPTLNANRDRLAFTIPAASGYDLVVYNMTNDQFLTVAQTKYPKGCMIGNYLLFTGETPLLNQVSIFGGSTSLWIYAVPIESAPTAP